MHLLNSPLFVLGLLILILIFISKLDLEEIIVLYREGPLKKLLFLDFTLAMFLVVGYIFITDVGKRELGYADPRWTSLYFKAIIVDLVFIGITSLLIARNNYRKAFKLFYSRIFTLLFLMLLGLGFKR